VGCDRLGAAAGIAGRTARASVAEKLGGCRTLAVSRPSPMAEALALQLGVPLHVLQGGARSRVMRGVARRGAAVANLSFVHLRQVVYDKYDPYYAGAGNWRARRGSHRSRLANRGGSRSCCSRRPIPMSRGPR